MTDPTAAAGGPLATPLVEGSIPPGCGEVRLERATYPCARIVATGLPCTLGDHGCGGETMTIIRAPQFGLNLPGEQVVISTEHCPVCGPCPQLHLVTPTEQELAWGWAPGTVG